MADNKLAITTEPKTFNFHLPKDASINLKDEIYSLIKHNELLAEHTIKNEIRQLLSNYKHGNNIHEHGKLLCGMMSLNYLMVPIQCQIFKVISSTS